MPPILPSCATRRGDEVNGTLHGYAAAVGVALVTLGAHYQSDVAAGYLVASAWAALAVVVITPERATTRGWALVLLAAPAVVAAALVAATVHPRVLDRIDLHRRLVAAAAGVAGLAASLVVAPARALERA